MMQEELGTDYAQGWDAIIKAMVARFEQLPLIGRAHGFMKYAKGNSDDPGWRDDFCTTDEQGRSIVSCVFIEVTTIPAVETSEDDSTHWTSEYKITLHVLYEFEEGKSWDNWHRLLRQITTDLRDGDRTFEKTCLTHSLPLEGDMAVANLGGVGCHSSEIRFTLQEAA